MRGRAGNVTMQIITNKMFEEIFVGDTTSVQHTLQRGDLRAWAAAFGDADMLPTQP